MKKFSPALFSIILLCIFTACTRSEYIQTGKLFSPVSENEEIAVFAASKPEQNYETIGTLRIRGGNTNKRIDEAKIYARKKGGNGLIARETGILTEPGTENVIEKIGTSTYETQEFVIIKFNSGKYIAKNDKLEEAKDDFFKAPAAGIPGKKDLSYDYNTLPRATYPQLVKNYQQLKDKLFRGTLYPKKIYKIPSSLKPYLQSGDRLVLLTTKSGKNKILMVIGMKDISAFKTKIKSGTVIDFVYSPVYTYKSKEGIQPVINFIEEVIQTQK